MDKSINKLTKKPAITPKQCKAARDLIGWKQSDLSNKSEIGESTIADFERGVRTPFARTLRDIRIALEEEGIEFLNNDKGIGVIELHKK
jgi:transcriptional regulator with XRE-family HTH domain